MAGALRWTCDFWCWHFRTCGTGAMMSVHGVRTDLSLTCADFRSGRAHHRQQSQRGVLWDGRKSMDVVPIRSVELEPELGLPQTAHRL